MLPADIQTYHRNLDPAHREICEALAGQISAMVKGAAGKVWHGHPVWFIVGNPIVGYSLKKAGVQLLFWSGQSFATPGLAAIGKFQAAGVTISGVDAAQSDTVQAWLAESERIQWDYANLPKTRSLSKLTDF